MIAVPKVRMTHPDLPDQPYWATPSAVPVLVGSGWEESPEPPKPAKPKPAPASGTSDAGGGPPVSPAARRRPIEPITSSTEE